MCDSSESPSSILNGYVRAVISLETEEESDDEVEPPKEGATSGQLKRGRGRPPKDAVKHKM